MNQKKTILATMMVVALVTISFAPTGISTVGTETEITPAAEYESVLERVILDAAGVEGSLGIDPAILDRLASRDLDEVANPAEAFAAAEETLASLREARGLSGSFAAAAGVSGLELEPRAPVAQPLALALLDFYGHSGYQPSALEVIGLQANVAGTDPVVADAVALIVTAMNDAAVARATGDQASMIRATGDLIASIEVAEVQLLSASAASTSCDPLFTDAEHGGPGLVIVNGFCDHTYTSTYALSIDLGGDDKYYNNAGGASLRQIDNLLAPSQGTPGINGLPARLLSAALAFNESAIVSVLNNDTALWDAGILPIAIGSVDYLVNMTTVEYDALADRLMKEHVEQFLADNSHYPLNVVENLTAAVAECVADCYVDPGLQEDNLKDNFPVAVAVDFGGDDIYSTTDDYVQGAGGNAIGVLVDTSGTDSYSAGEYAQGLGQTGVGVLIDGGGDDTYEAVTHAQGSMDAGLLLDLGGKDSYNAGYASQGGRTSFTPTSSSATILLDVSGDDTYTVDGIGQGAGGSLVDLEGNDIYDATGSQEVEFRSGHAQGVSIQGATGLLLDGAGNDKYTADIGQSQGYSSGGAVGALIDVSGDDEYVATGHAQGVCSSSGPGLLLDGSGDDSYTAGSGQGLSLAPCDAFLVDRDGTETYTLTGGPGQGGSYAQSTGVGALVDGGSSHDTYVAGSHAQGSSGAFGVGILVDMDGRDVYTSGDNSQGSAAGGVAALVDGLQDLVRSRTTFEADSSGASFGTRAASPGDTRGGDSYTASDNSQGHGSSPYGFGLLLDNDDESEKGGGPHANTYSAGIHSQGSAFNSGLGIILDREGRDSYTVSNVDLSRGYGNSSLDGPALGILVDAAGRDKYSDVPNSDANDHCIHKPETGVSIDYSTGVPDGCQDALVTNAMNLVDALLNPAVDDPSPCLGTDDFCDDVESDQSSTNPYDIDNNGTNEWRIVDQREEREFLNGENAHSGNRYWYVGLPNVTHVGYASASNATLLTPTFTLSSGADLTFRASGGAEACCDVLFVYAVDSTGSFTRVGGVAGSASYDTLEQWPMPDALVGQTIRLAFVFESDANLEDGTGYSVDDIRVA